MEQAGLIPKTIHYFWFGDKHKSEMIKKCINSWERILPEYKIIEWNEENFDVASCKYAAEAYECGKYAFVSDYARFKVLYEYGGFYLDTDVELLKPLDDLRNNELFMGFESDVIVAPGLITGAKRFNWFIGKLLNKYMSMSFENDGHLNLTTIGEHATSLLLREGLKLNGRYQRLRDITIYPAEYFCPYSYYTGALNITSRTYSIHHYDASWKDTGRLNAVNLKLRNIRLVTKLYFMRWTNE